MPSVSFQYRTQQYSVRKKQFFPNAHFFQLAQCIRVVFIYFQRSMQWPPEKANKKLFFPAFTPLSFPPPVIIL